MLKEQFKIIEATIKFDEKGAVTGHHHTLDVRDSSKVMDYVSGALINRNENHFFEIQFPGTDGTSNIFFGEGSGKTLLNGKTFVLYDDGTFGILEGSYSVGTMKLSTGESLPVSLIAERVTSL